MGNLSDFIGATGSGTSGTSQQLTGAAPSLDLSVANYFYQTLEENTTVAFSNPATPPTVSEFTYEITGASFVPKFDLQSVYNGRFDVSSEALTPTGVIFNNDGTKMYVVESFNDFIHQYSLSTGFDLGTATYDNVSFDSSSQATTPTGIAFNNDGTKLFLVCSNNNFIYQYSLSTAFDISTISYDFVSLYIAGTETNGQAIAFNNDGTKLYVLGQISDSVHQYSLSTAFNLSTASYDSISFNVSAQDTAPRGLAFKSDGTKMFMIGNSYDTIFQYSLSTAFNVSTASYDNISFDAGDEDSAAQGITFNNDGTKIYMVGSTTDSIYEYSLPTAYDLTSAGTNIAGFGIGSQDGSTRGLAFSSDGTKLYTVGDFWNTIYQYSLSVAFDITTASYDNVSFSVSSEDVTPTSLAFNSNGTKMYLMGSGSSAVYQYSLSTGFDVSTASYDSVSLSVSGQDTVSQGLSLSPDGTKLFVIGQVNDSVYQYSMSTAFDLSTASYDSVSFNISSQETGPVEVDFSNDGTKMFVLGFSSDLIHQYSLSTPFDLNTASYDSVSFYVAPQESLPQGFVFNEDGSSVYVVGLITSTVYQYRLTLAELATVTYPSSVTWEGGITPTIPGIGETDVLTFYTRDGGITYRGFLEGDAVS